MPWNKRMWIVVAYVLSLCPASAQNPVILKAGRVEYERKINAFALMKEMRENGAIPKERVEEYLRSKPQFQADRFILHFQPGQSLYEPLANSNAGEVSLDEWFAMVGNQNIVYSDFSKGWFMAEKTVFNNVYAVRDSLMPIKWKWTGELREIAGFQCRRANGLLRDSVYAVAFFASDIASSGGPETFHGLPGLILGMAIPEMHISWFATKVYMEAVTENAFDPLSRTKVLTHEEYLRLLMEMTKAWGAAGNPILKKAIF